MLTSTRQVLFCNTAWMNEYRGNVDCDPPYNGGSWIGANGWGSEVHNFLPYRGRVYGYVANAPHFKISIDKLGAPPDADVVHGVRVFWTATHPRGGRCLIGWYDDATIYRSPRQHPSSACITGSAGGRGYRTEYIISTAARNAHLLKLDDRVAFPIPDCRKPGVAWGMGQSNVRFLDKCGESFLSDLEARLRLQVNSRARPSQSGGRRSDPAKRIEVELAAMAAVRDHFGDEWLLEDRTRTLGIGYDFLATSKKTRHGSTLFIEVKGCAGSEACCELTPSELRCMEGAASRDRFRLCVVTNALDESRRCVQVFAYHPRLRQWTASRGLALTIERRVGARCHAA